MARNHLHCLKFGDDFLSLSLDAEHCSLLVHVLENYSSLLFLRLKKYGEFLSDNYSSDLKHQIKLLDDVIKMLGIGFKIDELDND